MSQSKGSHGQPNIGPEQVSHALHAIRARDHALVDRAMVRARGARFMPRESEQAAVPRRAAFGFVAEMFPAGRHRLAWQFGFAFLLVLGVIALTTAYMKKPSSDLAASQPNARIGTGQNTASPGPESETSAAKLGEAVAAAGENGVILLQEGKISDRIRITKALTLARAAPPASRNE